jgi:hypothetical protein
MTTQPPGSRSKKLRTSNFAECPLCDKLVELFDFSQAAALFHTDLQDIEFLTNTGSVHRVHNRKGEVKVCSISLFGCFDDRRTRLLDAYFEERIDRNDAPAIGAPLINDRGNHI